MMSSRLSTHSSNEAFESASVTAKGRTVLSGVVTGQIAGLVMAVVVMAVFALFLGKSPLYPVQVIGSALLGESALVGTNFAAILVGLVLHQAGPSLLWGATFGAVARRNIEMA